MLANIPHYMNGLRELQELGKILRRSRQSFRELAWKVSDKEGSSSSPNKLAAPILRRAHDYFLKGTIPRSLCFATQEQKRV